MLLDKNFPGQIRYTHLSTNMILCLVSCMFVINTVAGQYHVTNILQHANVIYPEIDSEIVSYYGNKIHKNKWHVTNPLEKTEVEIRQRRQKRDGLYGNFDPNAFNSQIGSSFNPNAFGSGSGSSGTSMFNMAGNGMSGTSTGTGSTSGSGTGGMSMFNPNAMTGFGTGGTGGFNSGTSGGSTSMTGGSSSSGTSSGGQPNYDPNNVINTGAKYDPNAANSGMGGSGGATPSFANGMGLNATQKIPNGGGPFGAATGSGSSGSSTTGSGSTSSNPASTFGSASSSSGSPASSFGSPSSAATSFGSASPSTGSSSSGSGRTQTSGTQSSGGGMMPMGSGGTVNGPSNMVPPGTGGATSGSSTSSGGFDPISTNSMATSGFNPLNPMMGKDMNLVMGPQSSTGNTGPGNFDPGKMNAQLGAQGMSLNMFGGAGGNMDLNKADAGSVMTGASGMMAGSNAINNGGNAVMSGGNTGMGTGMTPGSASTGTSSTSGSSGGSTFDPNKMSSGSGTGSGTGSTLSSSSSTGSMFNPNAMMGGGSINPMMPGGSSGMNPMMPGGSSGMNPMMPDGSMMGTSSGTRVSTGSSGSTSGSSSTPLDPLGAMAGGAKNFSGGNSLVDPQGFMQGGGLAGSMGNMFSMTGRDLNDGGHVQRSSKVQRRENTLRSLLTGNGFYNPMDPMGFIFEGNNKQYTEGNGKDTAPFDPNKFAFAYAAQVFGSHENSFIPGFVSAHAAQTPATIVQQNNTTPTKEPRHSVNTTDTQNSTPEQKEQMFLGLPVLSMRPSEILHENNMDHLRLNSSILFPEVAFSGKPGMLGIGSQTPVQPLKIEQVPNPEQQFIPSELKNISETSISPLSYNGYPGMVGVGQQQPARIQDGARLMTPRPQYNGYPGMMGDGHTTYTDDGINAPVGSSSSNNRSSQGDSADHNYIAMPSPSNWKGEWPGKTSSSRDWSGNWSEKWPSSTDPETKDVEAQNNTQGLSDGHTNNIVNWDGSWPGNQKDAETVTSTNNYNSDNLSQVIASLEKIMVLLQNSAASSNHDGGIGDDKHDVQRTFGQMAASWKDDMKVATS